MSKKTYRGVCIPKGAIPVSLQRNVKLQRKNVVFDVNIKSILVTKEVNIKTSELVKFDIIILFSVQDTKIWVFNSLSDCRWIGYDMNFDNGILWDFGIKIKKGALIPWKRCYFYKNVVPLFCICNSWKRKDSVDTSRHFPCIKMLQHHDSIEAAVPHLRRAVSAVF